MLETTNDLEKGEGYIGNYISIISLRSFVILERHLAPKNLRVELVPATLADPAARFLSEASALRYSGVARSKTLTPVVRRGAAPEQAGRRECTMGWDMAGCQVGQVGGW